MKITIDIRMLKASGIGVYIQNLVPRIIRMRPGDEFTLLGKGGEYAEWREAHSPNTRFVECDSPIYSLMEQIDVSVKIPNDTDLFWSPHYVIPLLYGGRLLATVHDLFHLAMPQFVGGFLKKTYAKVMFGQAAKKASGIAVISEFTKKELIRFTGVGPEKIQVTPLGIDSSLLNFVRKESPNPKPYFLFVGNIKPHKNLGRLLEAFALVKDKVPHDLILVGQREGFLTGDSEVQQKAESFGDRVKFTGRVERESLNQYYAHAEALVFPSLYEGFGLPPLEAMACGCPVVTSNAASIPEVCGDAVLYFDPLNPPDIAEKMMKLLTDKKLRDGFIQKGLKKTKQYSWDNCAEQTSALMDKILAT